MRVLLVEDDVKIASFIIKELLARLQALIRRSGGISDPTRLLVGDLSVHLLTRQVTRGGKRIDLQPWEFSLRRERLYRDTPEVRDIKRDIKA